MAEDDSKWANFYRKQESGPRSVERCVRDFGVGDLQEKPSAEDIAVRVLNRQSAAPLVLAVNYMDHQKGSKKGDKTSWEEHLCPLALDEFRKPLGETPGRFGAGYQALCIARASFPRTKSDGKFTCDHPDLLHSLSCSQKRWSGGT